ncbi:DUF397 domain-containing protein [Actinomadura rupiterrae]|uniref:DUF397 domain-containing protein n=1 Tax=Actinomadura rupiterrae TaxID=559627 RepID=UPI0027E2D53A|nr:DUF397 domain-containing protein [Actinomadura rupiterrae]
MTRWHKSKFSGGGNDDACVEIAHLAEGIGLRDSRDPDGPCLAVSPAMFGEFLAVVRHASAARPSRPAVPVPTSGRPAGRSLA